MKALDINEKQKYRYPESDWNSYARLFAAVTTSVQLAVYREACLHLHGKVVDCGCGSAKIAPFLADNEQVSNYTGIDYSAEMVTAAEWVVSTLERESFSIQHSKIEDAVGCYDSAVSIQSYYAWPEPLVTLRHIADLLVEGGQFVLATPNPSLSLTKLAKDARKELVAHPDFQAFQDYNLQLAANPQANFVSMDALIKQVQLVGFEVLECHQKHFQGGLNFLVLRKR
ncbi:methyltransferase domain-containing protein [uncultured Thiothrix sp.]|uniref:class I SAM-dependent methyltransferase n=1 Tax=uncultured Thiothrix sp. TaxID=223185 RepID=UPI0026195AF6|nr:methyltransferase domain-containing protein [uncultured Thiothrix sp.]